MTPVKDSLVVFLEGAKVNFKMYGFITPVFGCNIDGEPMIMPIIFRKPADKENFRQKILDMISVNKLKEFVFVSEAWTAVSKKEDMSDIQEWMTENGSLEGHPNREEIVSVLYCSATEEIQYTSRIIRGKIAILSEWQVDKRSGQFEISELGTRFQGLFAKGKSGQN